MAAAYISWPALAIMKNQRIANKKGNNYIHKQKRGWQIFLTIIIIATLTKEITIAATVHLVNIILPLIKVEITREKGWWIHILSVLMTVTSLGILNTSLGMIPREYMGQNKENKVTVKKKTNKKLTPKIRSKNQPNTWVTHMCLAGFYL